MALGHETRMERTPAAGAPDVGSLRRTPDWMRASVSGFMRTVPTATASRAVSALAEMSTMRARPASSRWERGCEREVIKRSG